MRVKYNLSVAHSYAYFGSSKSGNVYLLIDYDKFAVHLWDGICLFVNVCAFSKFSHIMSVKFGHLCGHIHVSEDDDDNNNNINNNTGACEYVSHLWLFNFFLFMVKINKLLSSLHICVCMNEYE